MEQLYRSRSNNEVVRRAPRQKASLATAIGRGLGMAGQVAGSIAADAAQTDEAIADSEFRIEQREKERERARRAVQFGGDVARAKLAYQEQRIALRAESGPGAPGWTEKASELQEQIFGPILDAYSDDEELAVRLAPVLQSTTQSLMSGEIAWADQQALQQQGHDIEALIDVERDTLQGTAPDQMSAALTESLARVETILEQTDYSGTEKEQLRRAVRATLLTNGALDGLLEQGQFGTVRALIESGDFAGMLGDHRSSYMRQVEAGERSQKIAAEQEQSAKRDEWRTRRNVLRNAIERGEGFAASDITALREQGAALGIEADELQELEHLATDGAYRSTARGLPDLQLRSTIRSLRDKRASGALSAEESQYLRQLEKEEGGRDEEKALKLTGLKSGDPVAAAADMAVLRGMGLEESYRVTGTSGDRAAFFLSRRLSPAGAAIAIEGRNTLANDRDAFMPRKKQGDKGDADLLDAEFRRVLGPNLTAQLIRTADYEAVRTAAAEYYAGWMVRNQGKGYSAALFERSVSLMFGRRDGKGGLGTVRGRIVELPNNMSAMTMDQVLSRSSFANARYSNGASVEKTDILANYWPKLISSDERTFRYALIGPQGRELKQADGSTWFIDVKAPR